MNTEAESVNTSNDPRYLTPQQQYAAAAALGITLPQMKANLRQQMLVEIEVCYKDARDTWNTMDRSHYGESAQRRMQRSRERISRMLECRRFLMALE